MKKDIKFSTRMASADREKIRALAAKAHMSMSDYVTACCLGKRIVVIDEQKELLRQLADLALLSNGLLKGKALADFISRSAKVVKDAYLK